MSSEKKPRVVFRCDGGTDIGMGHVVRCMALAEILESEFLPLFILKETDIEIYRRIESSGFNFETLPPGTDISEDLNSFIQRIQVSDLIVLDGYNYRTEYQKAIKSNGNFLVVIDDLNEWHHVADVVINHAECIERDNYDIEHSTLLLTGFENALLRKEFYKSWGKGDQQKNPRSVMISMGAADTQNLTYKYSQAIMQLDDHFHIHLLVSDLNPNLKALFKLADQWKHNVFIHRNIDANRIVELIHSCAWAICPASTISLECCASGIGLITGYTASNQKLILKGLTKRELAYNIGDMNKSVLEIQSTLVKIMNGKKSLEEMVSRQRKVFNESNRQNLLKVILEKYWKV